MIVIATVTEVSVVRGILTVKYIPSSQNAFTQIKKFGIAPKLTNIFKEFESKFIIFKLTQTYLGEEVEFLIPRENALKKSGLLPFASQGLNVNDANVYFVIDLLRQLEGVDPPLIIHKGIGFDVMETDEGILVPIFKGHKCLGGLESEYQGKLPIKPKGKFKDFQLFCKNHINHSPLALAFAIGLSSALVGFLGDKLQCDCLVAHFSGDSSTGKTTAAKLAVSTGSMPSFHAEHSLLNDYDGTENALLATLLGNKGFCCCFDEANMSASKDFSNFIYRLASGRGKRRLTKDGTQKDIETYLTVIISTGEKNLTRDSNQNTGKEIRVLTFDSMAWTEDAAHAETVNAFVKDNYGWPLYYLAKYLLKLGLDKVMECYEKNRMIFLEKSLVKDNFTSRLSSKYAFILTAVELANRCMKLELPHEVILETLLEHEAQTMDSRNIEQKAYDYLLEMYSVHNDRFNENDSYTGFGVKKPPTPKEMWGKAVLQNEPYLFVDERKCTEIVYFAKERFRDLLKKGNFEEPSVVIKKLKQRLWLDHDSDRDTRTRKITSGGASIDVYALRVFENPNCGDEKEIQERMQKTRDAVMEARKKKPAKKAKKKFTIEDLDFDDSFLDDIDPEK